MSFHGGLLGVVFAAWWWSRKHKLHLFDTVDFIAPLVPPGLGFGRLGNYINGELWGKPTGGNWGVVFPTDPALQGMPMQQTNSRSRAGRPARSGGTRRSRSRAASEAWVSSVPWG